MAPSEFAVMIGQTVSHYRVLEKLGSGGMGTIYNPANTPRTPRPWSGFNARLRPPPP
jgi:hypothetical protein